MSVTPLTNGATVLAEPLVDTKRLCLHTITTKPLDLREAVAQYAASGVAGISVWREAMEGYTTAEVLTLIDDHGLHVVSLVRGGFFVDPTPEGRQAAIDENKRIIDQAAAIGAPLVVLVCGAHPEVPLPVARAQILEGIMAVLPHAVAADVKLAIEPLHPMYADMRSAVNTLEQANDLALATNHSHVGVAFDVYHCWWDPQLEREIKRCGAHDKLLAYHVCDWKVPPSDLLLDRGLMGEGCIPLRQIRTWVEDAGFEGYIEVEIFSNNYWAQDQSSYIQAIRQAYLDHV